MKDKKKTLSVSKGYRLMPETHKLITTIKKNKGCSYDKVLCDAIKFYGRFTKKRN